VDGKLQAAARQLVVDGISLSAPPDRLSHIHIDDLTSGDGNNQVKTLDVRDVNVAALRDIFDASAYKNGTPAWNDRREVIGNLDARDISGGSPDDAKHPRLAEKSLLLQHLTMRPLAAPPMAGDDPRDTLKNVFSVTGIGNLKISGVTLDADKDIHGEQVHAALDTLSLQDAKEGTFSELGIDGLRVDAHGGQMNVKMHGAIAHFTMTGADFKSLVDLPAGSLDFHNPQVLVTNLQPALQKCFVAHSEMKTISLSFGLPNGGAVEMAIAGGAGDATRDPVTGMRHQTSQVEGMSLTGHGLPPAVDRTISIFGIDHLVVDASGQTDYDIAAQRIKINASDYQVHDLARIRFSGSFVGLGSPKPNPAAPLAGTILENLKLVYEDHSLVNRLIHVAATSSGRADSTFRESLIAQIHAAAMPRYNQSDNTMQMIAVQLENFVENPGKLTITMAPPVPVDLGDLGKLPANERLSRLGLSVVAGPLTDSATLISP